MNTQLEGTSQKQSRRLGQVTHKTTVWIEIKKTSLKHKMLIRENSRQNHA